MFFEKLKTDLTKLKEDIFLKRHVILYSATILIIIMIVFTPAVIAMFIPNTRLVMLSKQSYCDYVTANGCIEERAVKNITSKYPVVPSAVYFEAGDKIKKGQILADVDRDATLGIISEAYKTNSGSPPASLAAAAPLNQTAADYSGAENMIPDKITAACGGRLSSVKLAAGEPCEAGVVATVSGVNNLCAKIQINESDINLVKIGQQVKLTGSGFLGKSYTGRIVKIYPTAKKQLVSAVQETVVEAVASIDDCDEKIMTGFTVTAEIKVSEPKRVNVLPYEAISQDGDGNEFVYVFKNGRAKKQLVKTGISLKSGQAIESGVNKTDFIIYKAESIKQDETFVNVILDRKKE